MTEPEPERPVRTGSVLVETGGEAERIAEGKSGNIYRHIIKFGRRPDAAARYRQRPGAQPGGSSRAGQPRRARSSRISAAGRIGGEFTRERRAHQRYRLGTAV